MANQESQQEKRGFPLPVIAVVVLVACAALLVMNGARPVPAEGSPAQESKGSRQSQGHAKPPREGDAESSGQNHQPAETPNALGQSGSSSHEVPLGDTPEPELTALTPHEEHSPDAESLTQ